MSTLTRFVLKHKLLVLSRSGWCWRWPAAMTASRHDQAPDQQLRHARRRVPRRRPDPGAVSRQRCAGPDRAGDHTACRHHGPHPGCGPPARSGVRHGPPSHPDCAGGRLRHHPRLRRSSTRDGRSTYALVFAPADRTRSAPRDLTARIEQAISAAAPSVVAGTDHRHPGARDQHARRKGAGVLAEAMLGGLGALVVLAFVFAQLPGLRPAADGRHLDPHHLPGPQRADPRHRRQPDRRVPDRPDRPRRRDRLLAAGGHPLARGARPRPPTATTPSRPRWPPPAGPCCSPD